MKAAAAIDCHFSFPSIKNKCKYWEALTFAHTSHNNRLKKKLYQLCQTRNTRLGVFSGDCGTCTLVMNCRGLFPPGIMGRWEKWEQVWRNWYCQLQTQDILFSCSHFLPGEGSLGSIQNDRNLVEEGGRLFRSQFEIAGITNFCKSGMHALK